MKEGTIRIFLKEGIKEHGAIFFDQGALVVLKPLTDEEVLAIYEGKFEFIGKEGGE